MIEAINLPRSIELEKSILGAMLLDKNCIPLVIGHLKKEVFYDLKHQQIYDIISKMFGSGQSIDLISVAQKLKGETDEINAYYLTQLTDSITSSYHIHTHIEIVVELYKKREAFLSINSHKNKILDADNQSLEVISSLNSELIKIQEFGNIYEKTIEDVVMSLNFARDMAKSGELLGINTGFNELNQTLSGWCKPDFVILAARPGAGKTAFMLSSVYNLCIVNGVSTAIFSLEMSSEQLVERLESITSMIPLKRLRMNLLNDEERVIMLKADDKLLKAPLYIEDTGGISLSQIRSKAIILKQKYDIKVIFIDYIQLMSSQGKSNQNREQEVSTISRGLKSLAKELEVPIIALSQLSRRVEERADKLPLLSDLRESGSLEQDADAVIMLMRPAYYEQTEPVTISGKEYPADDVCIVKVEKNRHGQTRNVALRFFGDTMTFSDYIL